MVRAAQAVAAILAFIAIGAGGVSAAGGFPERPIRLIISFPAGGSSDAMARIVQPNIEKQLGQPIVIENRGGAGGTIAMDMVAKASADGYTIGLGGAGALGVNMGLQEKPQYDPQKDLLPVT